MHATRGWRSETRTAFMASFWRPGFSVFHLDMLSLQKRLYAVGSRLGLSDLSALPAQGE